MKKDKINITVHTPKDLEIQQNKEGFFTMQRKFKKVYRNQPCTCGSGVKAKKCCYSPYSE